MDIKIECRYDSLVPIEDMRPNPDNNNKHTKDQIERFVEILKYQGFKRPIDVSIQSGFIVVGEGRYLAAKKAKMKEVPVVFQNYLTTDGQWDSDKEYADLTADNALNKYWADLDMSKINDKLKDLGPDFDIDLLGFKKFYIDPLEKNQDILGQYEISKELDEKNDYIILLFKDKKKFKTACEKLNIKTVAVPLSKNGNDKMTITGLGRVVDGNEFIDRL